MAVLQRTRPLFLQRRPGAGERSPGSGAAGVGARGWTQCRNGGVLGWVQAPTPQGATSSFRNVVLCVPSFPGWLCPTQNKLRIKFGKKRTEGFLVLLFPRLPRVVVGFTYDRGSWHNPWGQCGEEVSFFLKWRLYFWEQCRFTVTLRGVEISHILPVAPPSRLSTGPSALHSPHHPPGEDSVSFIVFFAGFILGHRISQKQPWSPSLLWWREVTESRHQLSWDQTEETCFGSQWRIAVRAWTLEPNPGSTLTCCVTLGMFINLSVPSFFQSIKWK